MATFVMLGRMSVDSMRESNPQQLAEAMALIKKNGGELKAGFGMMGKYELLLILEMPNIEQMMKTSVGLTKMLGGITFITSPAFTLEEANSYMVED